MSWLWLFLQITVKMISVNTTFVSLIIMTSSIGNIFYVTVPLYGNHRSPVDSPHRGTVTWPFAVTVNKLLNKNSIDRSFETPVIWRRCHYIDVIMSAMTSQISNLTNVYSTVCSSPDQRKHQSSAPLVFVRGIHRWPVSSPHKKPVMRKIFPFDNVIMII